MLVRRICLGRLPRIGKLPNDEIISGRELRLYQRHFAVEIGLLLGVELDDPLARFRPLADLQDLLGFGDALAQGKPSARVIQNDLDLFEWPQLAAMTPGGFTLRVQRKVVPAKGTRLSP